MQHVSPEPNQNSTKSNQACSELNPPRDELALNSLNSETQLRPAVVPLRQTRSKNPRSLSKRDFRCNRLLAKLSDDTGAVTAEYAVIIIAAVAFAGVLVAIMRSDEVRSMLVDLVQRALGSAG